MNVTEALEPRSTARVGTLSMMSGLSLGAVFILEKADTVIGSELGADVVLGDAGVSRRHACIHRVGERYEISDLASTNGTFVEGVRVEGRVPLPIGARVFVANCMFRFAEQDALEASTAKSVYEQSVRDEMTHLYNRRYLDQRLVAEVAFARRQGTALGLILIDIDRFKDVNDGFGHQAGDHVLREVANLWSANARAEDVLARSGGEEFAVIVRGVDAAGVLASAERMRKLVQRSRITWQGQRVPVTISVGVAHNQLGTRVSEAEQLYAIADEALYAAKHAGRNRCHLSGGRRITVDFSDEAAQGTRQAESSSYDAVRRSSN